MRLIDFFVYYEATLYKSKEQENRDGNKRLSKAISIATIIVATWLTIITQVISYLILKRNAINITVLKFVFIAFALIMIFTLRYIYISKERYKYIISNQYPSFKFGRYTGIFIVFLALLGSIILSITIGEILENF